MFEQEYLSVTALGVIKFVLSIFIFRSVSYVFCSNDNNVRKHYHESNLKIFFITNLKHVLKNKFFYTNIACVFVLSLLLPSSFAYGYVIEAFWCNVPLNTGEIKLRTLMVMLPLIFIINIFSYLAAYRKFRKQKSDDEASSPVQTIKQLALVFLVYCGACICIPWFLPFIITIWNLAKRYNVVLFAVILVLALVLIVLTYVLVYFVRALLKRRTFVKKLVNLCEKGNAKLSKIEKPYMSVFFQREGINFSVEKSERKYDCKFISGVFYNSPIIFSNKGSCICKHSFRILGIELFQILSKIDFSFDCDGKKILIVSPVPQKIYVSNDNEKPRPADTGDEAGDYKIFTATGFINALERDCIDVQ